MLRLPAPAPPDPQKRMSRVNGLLMSEPQTLSITRPPLQEVEKVAEVIDNVLKTQTRLDADRKRLAEMDAPQAAAKLSKNGF